MIKLKDIWIDLIKEGASSDHFTEMYDFTGIHIPALVQPSDVLEIFVEIDYDYEPGVPPSYHDHSGEEERFMITGWNIIGVKITPKKGKPREITDLDLLHKETKKTLKSLVKNQIETHAGSYRNKIGDQYEE